MGMFFTTKEQKQQEEMERSARVAQVEAEQRRLQAEYEKPEGVRMEQRHRQAEYEEPERLRIVARREFLEHNPFDERTEVSRSAQKIVNTLWIIFVLLPVVSGILYWILYTVVSK